MPNRKVAQKKNTPKKNPQIGRTLSEREATQVRGGATSPSFFWFPLARDANLFS